MAARPISAESIRTNYSLTVTTFLEINLLLFFLLSSNRAFSLTWPASMHIYGNKKDFLHKKRVQLQQDLFGTPIWPPFHCWNTNMAAVTSGENALYSGGLRPGSDAAPLMCRT